MPTSSKNMTLVEFMFHFNVHGYGLIIVATSEETTTEEFTTTEETTEEGATENEMTEEETTTQRGRSGFSR